jgi:hypothetical protein
MSRYIQRNRITTPEGRALVLVIDLRRLEAQLEAMQEKMRTDLTNKLICKFDRMTSRKRDLQAELAECIRGLPSDSKVTDKLLHKMLPKETSREQENA